MACRSRNSGFTLVEVLVVLLVLMILQNTAVPALVGISNSAKVSSATSNLFSGLTLARSEAIKRGSRSVLCKSADGLVCAPSGDWGQGWIVFHDANNNGDVDIDELVLAREGELSSSIRLAGNTPVKSYVSYTPTGAAEYTSGAFQAGTFTVCARSAGAAETRKIVISSSGRPRVAKSTEAQCL